MLGGGVGRIVGVGVVVGFDPMKVLFWVRKTKAIMPRAKITETIR